MNANDSLVLLQNSVDIILHSHGRERDIMKTKRYVMLLSHCSAVTLKRDALSSNAVSICTRHINYKSVFAVLEHEIKFSFTSLSLFSLTYTFALTLTISAVTMISIVRVPVSKRIGCTRTLQD